MPRARTQAAKVDKQNYQSSKTHHISSSLPPPPPPTTGLTEKTSKSTRAGARRHVFRRKGLLILLDHERSREGAKEGSREGGEEAAAESLSRKGRWSE